jgi:type II secretory pathway component PulM
MMPLIPKALSPRDRRALVWGGVVVAGALVVAFALKPYFRTLAETRDDVRVQRELLARERAVVRASNALPAALQESRTALAQQSTPLFSGLDELSATSNLSDQITRAALANSVLISSLETKKTEALDQGIVALAVDFRAESDFEGILRFLNSLERGDRLINVSALAIQRLDRPVASGVPDTEVLAISGTITGYGVFPP